MRRASDFLMMVAAGVTAVIVMLGGIAGAAPAAGTDHLWVATGIGGFMLGLSWRFLFWDLPGMIWHLFMHHRYNLQYVCMLCAGVVILVFI